MTTYTGNTQPIYPGEVLRWKATVASQTVPRVPTVQVPVKLGTAGENGAIIHRIDCQHLGNNIATVVRLYSQMAGAVAYNLELELDLTAVTTANETNAIAPVAFTLPSILPAGNTGLHLASGESLYIALGTAIASGIIVTARGGNY